MLNLAKKPAYARLYAVPKVHKDIFKKKLNRLVELGVLAPDNESPWASLAFIIPKKNGAVCFLMDLQKVNSKIEWKPYLIPKIMEVMQNWKVFSVWAP